MSSTFGADCIFHTIGLRKNRTQPPFFCVFQHCFLRVFCVFFFAVKAWPGLRRFVLIVTMTGACTACWTKLFEWPAWPASSGTVAGIETGVTERNRQRNGNSGGQAGRWCTARQQGRHGAGDSKHFATPVEERAAGGPGHSWGHRDKSLPSFEFCCFIEANLYLLKRINRSTGMCSRPQTTRDSHRTCMLPRSPRTCCRGRACRRQDPLHPHNSPQGTVCNQLSQAQLQSLRRAHPSNNHSQWRGNTCRPHTARMLRRKQILLMGYWCRWGTRRRC